MAWNSSTAHYSGEVADMPDVLNGLALDDRTWGGAVDAANNPLANLGSFRLTPQALPTSPTPGTVACDIVDGKTKQYVDSTTGWLVIGGAAKGDTALWYSGSGAPSSGLGSNGDMYINTATGDFYGPKAAGSWGSIAGNLKGPQGTQGIQGIQGIQGVQGNPGVAYTAKGAYAAGTTYAQGDEVTYSNALYISLQASNTGHTPSTSPTYWQNVGTSGLADPGGPGIIKQVSTNVTAPATRSDVRTLAGNLETTDYDFAAQALGGTLTGGTPATVTLSPVPVGVNGADANHYLYITGGTGTAEAVLITGGTATSGGASGTVTFTPTNSHSGAWTIKSASAGIQEAISAAANGDRVILPAGNLSAYATITVPAAKQISLRGQGITATALCLQFAAGDGILYDATTYGFVDISGFRIDPQVTRTSGYDLHVKAAVFGSVCDLYTRNTLNAFEFENCNSINVTRLTVQTYTGIGFFLNASTSPTSGGFYSHLDATGGTSTATPMLIKAATGAAFAGTVLSNINLQGGANLIQMDPNGGALNEFLFQNVILDSWTTRGIWLQPQAGGTGNGIQFRGLRVGSTLDSGGGIVYGYTGFSNVDFVDMQGWSAGEGFVLLGVSNWRVRNCHISGNGGAGASNIAFDVWLNSATPCSQVLVSNCTFGFGETGGTTGSTATIGVRVDSGAHGLEFIGVRGYGSTAGLSYAGTGTCLIRDCKFTNTTKPAAAASLRGSTWYTEAASSVADTFEVCRKDAANAYAWVALY